MKPKNAITRFARCMVVFGLVAEVGILSSLATAELWSKVFDGSTSTYPNDAFLASPTIGSDGTVYIAGALPDPLNGSQRRLYAINGSTGAMLSGWPVHLGARVSSAAGLTKDKGVESTAALGSDGMLYVGSWNYNIYKINPVTRAVTAWTPTGTQPKGILRTAPIVANGYLFCWMDGDPSPTVDDHPHVVVLNASTMAYVASWFDTGVVGDAIASPALGRDNKLYVATHYLDYSDPEEPPIERTGKVYSIDVSTKP